MPEALDQPESHPSHPLSVPLINQSPATPDPLHSVPWPFIWFIILTIGPGSALLASLITHQHPNNVILGSICLMTCITAAVFDAASGRIPNQITYTAILLGFFLNCLFVLLSHFKIAGDLLTPPGATQSLEGFALAAALGMIMMAFGTGGGDMKLMAGIGAMLGFHETAVVFLCALIVALPYAVINLMLSGRLNLVVRLAATDLLILVTTQSIPTPSKPGKSHVPLAVALALGLLLSHFTQMKQWFTNILF